MTSFDSSRSSITAGIGRSVNVIRSIEWMRQFLTSHDGCVRSGISDPKTRRIAARHLNRRFHFVNPDARLFNSGPTWCRGSSCACSEIGRPAANTARERRDSTASWEVLWTQLCSAPGIQVIVRGSVSRGRPLTSFADRTRGGYSSWRQASMLIAVTLGLREV